MFYVSIQNASPRWEGSAFRSGWCEMTILSSYPRIMFGLSSNHAPFYWRSNPLIFGSNLELRAAEISGVRNVAFFHTKCVAKMGGVSSPKRQVRDDNFIVGLPSANGHPRIAFLYGRSKSRIFGWNLELRISWRVQYLVMLEVIPVALRIVLDVPSVTRINHQSSASSFFVVGAVLGDVEGRFLLLCALYWTFHMWRGSIISHQRHIFFVAGAVFGDVGGRFLLLYACVTRIKHESRSSIAFCIPYVGLRNVQEVSCVATKSDMRLSNGFLQSSTL